ncbi:hypothetical protein GCK32_017687, partial [Trichostrongylus colubriformis]
QLLNPDRPELFKLTSSYYILFASGGFVNDELQYHSNDRYVMPRTSLVAFVNGVGRVENQFQDNTTESTLLPSRNDLLKIVHGILMTISWMIFLSTGMLFAGNKEGPCPSKMVLGQKLWFQCHRALNLLGILGSLIGIFCMIIANEWQWRGPVPGRSPEL